MSIIKNMIGSITGSQGNDKDDVPTRGLSPEAVKLLKQIKKLNQARGDDGDIGLVIETAGKSPREVAEAAFSGIARQMLMSQSGPNAAEVLNALVNTTVSVFMETIVATKAREIGMEISENFGKSMLLAIEALDDAVKLGMPNLNEVYAQAQSLADQGKKAEARKLLTDAIEKRAEVIKAVTVKHNLNDGGSIDDAWKARATHKEEGQA